MRRLGYFLIATYWGLQATALACDAASDIQRPRVPPQDFATARSLKTPWRTRRMSWSRGARCIMARDSVSSVMDGKAGE
jgi:hypothetical protein